MTSSRLRQSFALSAALILATSAVADPGAPDEVIQGAVMDILTPMLIKLGYDKSQVHYELYG